MRQSWTNISRLECQVDMERIQIIPLVSIQTQPHLQSVQFMPGQANTFLLFRTMANLQINMIMTIMICKTRQMQRRVRTKWHAMSLTWKSVRNTAHHQRMNTALHLLLCILTLIHTPTTLSPTIILLNTMASSHGRIVSLSNRTTNCFLN